MTGEIDMTQKIDFYCDHCECNSDVEWYLIDTLGFEIECPECGYVWKFATDNNAFVRLAVDINKEFCVCHKEYSERGLIDPSCQAHDIASFVLERTIMSNKCDSD